MTRGLLVFSLALAAIGSSFAGAPEVAFDGQGSGIEEVLGAARSLPAPPAAVAERNAAGAAKDWTIMVYVNGKNDLEASALADVNEMESVGSTDRVNIVVELGRIKGHDESDGAWTGARRYLIKSDNELKRVSSPVLEDIPKADMGDWRHLAEFGRWAKENFPARRTMLIVWDHGNGWYFTGRGPSTKAISHDAQTGHQILTVDLAKALSDIGRLDIYGSDACLMQMAEVAFEVRGSADYVLGSEDLEPTDGYPYAPLLRAVTADPGMSPAGLGRTAVDSFAEYYRARGMSTTLSLVKTAALAGFSSKLDEWTSAVVSSRDPETFKAAHGQVLRFCNGNLCFNVDLHHLVRLVAERTASPEVSRASRALLDAMERDLVVHSRALGRDAEARGIAVYLPTYYYDEDYDRLAWARHGAWSSFARWALGIVKPPYP